MTKSFQGLLAMLVAVCFFSLMTVLAKRCAQLGLTGPEITWYRSLTGIVVLLVFWLLGRAHFVTRKPVALVLRGVIGGLSLLCYFVAIASIPVADAAFLNNTSPIFATIGGNLFLGEKMTRVSIPSLLLSLTGVYLILKPSLNTVPWEALSALASGFLAGFVYVAVRHLRRTDSSAMIFLAFTFGGLFFSSFWIGSFHIPTLLQLPWLLAMGLAAAAAQFLLSVALTHSEASEASTIGLLSPLLTALLASLLLGEPLTPNSVLGGGLIVAGGALILWWRRKERNRD
jgi:drug/metabolite transporter (DMT)-like permease